MAWYDVFNLLRGPALGGPSFGRNQPTNKQMNPTQGAAQRNESFLMGAPAGMQQISNLNPPIAQQARERFEQQTVPSLAERFAGAGKNAPSSGVFAQMLGGAGAGMNTDLAALQAQYDWAGQGRNQALNQWLFQMGSQPQFQNVPIPEQPGALSELAGGILPGIASLGTRLLAAYASGGTSEIPELLKAFAGIAGQQKKSGSTPSLGGPNQIPLNVPKPGSIFGGY